MSIGQTILHYTPHILSGGTGLFLFKWLGGKLINAIRNEWKAVTERLARIETVQGVQAENHLSTIEKNTARTNELLEKLHDGQLEMSGFLKGLAERK